MKAVSHQYASAAGVGTVRESGEGASRFRMDQRVVAAPWPSNVGNGTWQQYVAVKEEVCGTISGRDDDVTPLATEPCATRRVDQTACEPC